VLRLAALAEFADRRLGDTFLVRTAGVYGWGIVVTYAVLIALDPASAPALLDRAFVTLAWVPGTVIAFAAARDAGGAEESSGDAFLAGQRGLDHRELAIARFFGVARRIGRTVGVRAVLVSLYAASHAAGVGGGVDAVRWVLGAVLFAIVLGLGLAALSRGAALVLPGRGRLLLVAAVLLPVALSLAWPGAPNLPAIFRGLAPEVLGGGAT